MRYVYQRAAALTILALLLQACATFGVPTPETFNQRADLALRQVTSVRTTANQLLQVDAISVNDNANLHQHADVTRAGIDLAITLNQTDPDQALRRLVLSEAAVNALIAYLNETKAGANP